MNVKEQTVRQDMRNDAVNLITKLRAKEKVDINMHVSTEEIQSYDNEQIKQDIFSTQQDGESENKQTNVILPFKKQGEYFIETVDIKRKPIYDIFKRIFDIVSSVIALIVLAIPMLIISIMIKIKSPGPVFYKQERLGLNGKKIIIVKFRTMDVNAEATGAQWSKGDDDPRIFPLGRKLRKARFDELPQLVAVFCGQLSLCGPRPERECFYDEFETYVHGFHERLKVKPGLTGLAQVNGGYDLKPEEKIVWDIEYIKKRSMWLDLKILCKTVAVIFKHDGAK